MKKEYNDAPVARSRGSYDIAFELLKEYTYLNM